MPVTVGDIDGVGTVIDCSLEVPDVPDGSRVEVKFSTITSIPMKPHVVDQDMLGKAKTWLGQVESWGLDSLESLEAIKYLQGLCTREAYRIKIVDLISKG